MKTRKLGGSGLEVSPICLGGNVFGWTADEPASFAILDAFVGAGFNFVDTADVYSRWVPGHKGGESETVLGNWFKRSGNRKKVILATKVGIELGARQEGAFESVHSARSGRLAAAPADRLHRPVSIAHRRRERAVGRNARGLRSIDQAGQGARDRRVELSARSGWPRR